MPRKKNILALTQGFLPVNLPASTVESIFHGTGLKDRVLLFYKVIFNSYKLFSSDRLNYHEYVPIHSTLVEKLFGEPKAKNAIQTLVQNGLIDMIERFYEEGNPNSHPRKFRIPPDLIDIDLFQNGKLYTKVDILDKKAYNAYRNYQVEKHKQILSKSNCDILKRLAKHTQDVYLDLTSPAAKKLIEDNKLNVERNGLSYFEYLEQLDNRDIEWFKRDYYGRVHFAWVSLNKRCHDLIRFKGFDDEYCDEVDIANSQPFFSSIIDNIANVFPQAQSLIHGIDFTTSDWYIYRTICKKGIFYEHWMVALNRFLGDNWLEGLLLEQQEQLAIALQRYEVRLAKWVKNPIDKKTGKKRKKPIKPKLKADLNKCKGNVRTASKLLFYSVIFNTQNDTNNISECFRKWLPSVWQAFKQIKSRYTPLNPSIKNKAGKGSYTNLSWLMTVIESKVVIDTCLKSLFELNITQVIPRHDSLMAPSSLIDKVEIALIDAFISNDLPVPTIKKKI